MLKFEHFIFNVSFYSSVRSMRACVSEKERERETTFILSINIKCAFTQRVLSRMVIICHEN